MKTAIVILNWNGRKFLEEFLPGLIESCPEDSAVIVADNASDDGSMEMIAKDFPEVKTMIFSKNRGYTGGYNRALMEIDAEYFVLINSDVEVPCNWIYPLLEWMDSHPECGICAPKLLSYDNKDMFEYAGAAGGYIDKLGYPFCRGRLMDHVEKDEGQYDDPAQVFWASGACMMVRASLYKELGGLDERFFAHMEEIDFCWRAQLEGWTVCTVPASTVFHVGGGTLPKDSPWKLYLNFRNNLLMLDNNLSKTKALEMLSRGHKVKDAAKKGERMAGRLIFLRMLLDGCAAMIYLLSFKGEYFKAVFKAHKDYRRLKSKATKEETSAYLKRKGKSASVKGMYDGWIIPKIMFYGKNAASKIKMQIPDNE